MKIKSKYFFYLLAILVVFSIPKGVLFAQVPAWYCTFQSPWWPAFIRATCTSTPPQPYQPPPPSAPNGGGGEFDIRLFAKLNDASQPPYGRPILPGKPDIGDSIKIYSQVIAVGNYTATCEGRTVPIPDGVPAFSPWTFGTFEPPLSGWTPGPNLSSFTYTADQTYTFIVECSGTISVGDGSVGFTAIRMISVIVNSLSSPPPFDFWLSHGGDKTVVQGDTITNTITATLESGSSMPISFGLTNLPGASLASSFSPPSVNPTSNTLLTIDTADIPPGVYAPVVSGSTGLIPITASCNESIKDDTATPGSYIHTIICTDNIGNGYVSTTDGGSEWIIQEGIEIIPSDAVDEVCNWRSYTVPQSINGSANITCADYTAEAKRYTYFILTVTDATDASFPPPTNLNLSLGACSAGDTYKPVVLKWDAPVGTAWDNYQAGFKVYREDVADNDVTPSGVLTYTDYFKQYPPGRMGLPGLGVGPYKYSVTAGYSGGGSGNIGGESVPISGQITTELCSVTSPSGSLTSSDCTINPGFSSCPSSINWNTVNPLVGVTSVVTTPTSITVSTGNSGLATYPVTGGNPSGQRTFYLYHNGQLLNQTSASATCVNSTWDVSSGTCKAPVSAINVTLTASPPGPLTEPGATTLTWTTTGSPTSCTASNDWSGLKATTGVSGGESENITGLTEKTYTYTITCSKAGTASVSRTINVVVNPAAVAGSCNGSIPSGSGVLFSPADQTAVDWTFNDPPTLTCQWACKPGYSRLGNELKCRPIPGWKEF